MLDITQSLHPLLVLLIMIALAYALGEICHVLKIPRVAGQLLAGIILGTPWLKPLMVSENTQPLLHWMSQIGILLLFFFVGLQINLRNLKKELLEDILVSTFNTAIPLIVGILVAYYVFNLSLLSSLIIGICLAMSAAAASIDVLEELGLMRSRIGKVIMSSGTIDDFVELILVSIIFALMHMSTGRFATKAVLFDLSTFIVAIIALRYIIIPILLSLFAAEKKLTYLFTGAIVITLILALITEYLGLGTIIGALFAGIMVKEILLSGKKKRVWEEHNIAKAIHIISFGFFVPLFFVWAGMSTDITLIFTNTALMITMLAIALAGTVGGTILGMVLHKESFVEGMLVGWGLAPKGDIELVIASLALGKNIISPDVFSALILMAFFSTLIAPVIFRYMVKRYSSVIKQ